MRTNRLSLIASLGLLSACAAADKGPGNLADACQLKPCTCVEEGGSAFFGRKTADLLWKRSGEAYCPEGFVLRLAPKKK